ncbi:MAG: hypothetical protein ABIE14_02335 [Patescibacteria group bacterium]
MKSIINLLFGKILKHVGDNIFLLYQKYFIKNDKDYYDDIQKLPYVRYGNCENYYKTTSWKNKEGLLKIEEYKTFLDSIPKFKKMRKCIIEKLIREFKISSFNQADIFFVSMCLLHINKNKISQKYLEAIFRKTKDNSEALFKLTDFLTHISELQPKLLSKEMKKFLKSKKQP